MNKKEVYGRVVKVSATLLLTLLLLVILFPLLTGERFLPR
jgi:hypothetical protein